MVERIPPHSLEAERAALGSVFIRPSTLDDLAQLQVDDFFLPAHREIIDAMRDIARRGRPVDFVAVSDELKMRQQLDRLDKGEMYLLKLANDTPTAENAAYYAMIVSEKAALRRTIATCADTISSAYGDASDVSALISDHRARMAEIELAGSAGPERVGDLVESVIDGIQHRAEKPEEFLVPTSIKAFDRRYGGLRENHLIVVAARPGRGKTALAVGWAVDAAIDHGIPALIFSVEMQTDELVERMLSKRGKVNGDAVGRGRMDLKEWGRVNRAAGALTYQDAEGTRRVPLYIDDRKHKASRICAEARRWRAKHPDPRALIVIDYLGLVEPDADERMREREVAKMSRMFKLLAHKSQARAPVVLCCQLNRELVGKDGKMRKPIMSDLKESGAIEADADAIVFPWWEGETPARGRHPAELLIGKFRGKHPSTVKVDWEGEFTSFSDRLEDEDNPQEDLPL
jgi:replicative DNA helicase